LTLKTLLLFVLVKSFDKIVKTLIRISLLIFIGFFAVFYVIQESNLKSAENRSNAIESLVQALNNENLNVHRAAAAALEEIKSEKTVEPLSQALKDENSDVRYFAASALGRIYSKQNIFIAH
jgi:HEAT repeat protein